MNFKIDLPTVTSITALLALLGAAFGYLIATVRKAGADVNKANADGWKQAAELKASEIISLKERLTKAEADVFQLQESYKKLNSEHGEVIRLNVELQLKCERQDDIILALRTENTALKGMHRELPVFHQEHNDTERIG